MDTFRKEYTPLNDRQKQEMAEIKDKAQELFDLIDKVDTDTASGKTRCLALAKTNLEQAVMWAIKGVTTKSE